MVKNGYFIITVKQDGTYVSIVEPQEGGKRTNAEEIIEYLNSRRFEDFNKDDIRAAFKNIYTASCFKISDTAMNSSAAFCVYNIDKNKMSAEAILYPPVGNGSLMTVSEMEGDLMAKGITYGVDAAIIKEVVENKIYNTPFVFARGTEPVQGKDASIEYLFNTKQVAKPKINSDGTVDYHELDLITKVSAEQVVARIIPVVKGTPGKNIMGAELPPERVTKKNFKFSRNAYISEDGLSLISKVNGHVTLEGDKIFISDIYDVPVDVDNTTGDISYEGNIIVHGNVRAGFTLKASGDITIMGVVEGANVDAGGNLTVNRGIQGMNKAVVHAGGDITTKFVENATVSCGGSIETDSLLHCSTSAGDKINVSGKNGLLVGGTARAGSIVTAKQIGNNMGTVTNVYVGVDPALRKRVKELAAEITKANSDRTKFSQVVAALRKKMELEGRLDSQKQEMLQTSMKNLIMLEQSIRKMTEEYNAGKQTLSENVEARVKITDCIYPGTKLSFGDTEYRRKDKTVYCQYAKQGADVVMLPL